MKDEPWNVGRRLIDNAEAEGALSITWKVSQEKKVEQIKSFMKKLNL